MKTLGCPFLTESLDFSRSFCGVDSATLDAEASPARVEILFNEIGCEFKIDARSKGVIGLTPHSCRSKGLLGYPFSDRALSIHTRSTRRQAKTNQQTNKQTNKQKLQSHEFHNLKKVNRRHPSFDATKGPFIHHEHRRCNALPTQALKGFQTDGALGLRVHLSLSDRPNLLDEVCPKYVRSMQEEIKAKPNNPPN